MSFPLGLRQTRSVHGDRPGVWFIRRLQDYTDYRIQTTSAPAAKRPG
jgi:hypothetical protein